MQQTILRKVSDWALSQGLKEAMLQGHISCTAPGTGRGAQGPLGTDLWAAGQRDQDKCTAPASDAHFTEQAHGGYCSNLNLEEAMRQPELCFQNLLSPTAFGRLWAHSVGLSSCF